MVFTLCLLEMTPLHFASFSGHSEVFKFLCNHGDDPGAKTDLGLTTLHLACHNGHLEVVKQYDLFTKKEERAKEDSFGKYPIHYAAEKGFQEVILFSFSQTNTYIIITFSFYGFYLSSNNLTYLIHFTCLRTTFYITLSSYKHPK